MPMNETGINVDPEKKDNQNNDETESQNSGETESRNNGETGSQNNGETESQNNDETESQNSEEKEEKNIKRIILDYAVIIGIVVLVGFLVQAFLLVNAEIPSGSMENTIMPGDRIYGNRLAYQFSDPERYDIVIFKYPDDESQLFIKRIIGMPGETVIISGGEVYVTDSGTVTRDIPDEELIADPMMLPGTILTDDSFIAEEMRSSAADEMVFRVPEDSYFMLGDNRNYSKDSRYWKNHFVARDKLVGKALIRYWPLNKISLLGYDGDAK